MACFLVPSSVDTASTTTFAIFLIFLGEDPFANHVEAQLEIAETEVVDVSTVKSKSEVSYLVVIDRKSKAFDNLPSLSQNKLVFPCRFFLADSSHKTL